MTKIQSREVELVAIPDRRVIAVDGEGDPEKETFTNAVRSLYSVAYGAKFALKKRGCELGKVGQLEALWSGVTDVDGLSSSDRNSWRWTAVIEIPEQVTQDVVDDVTAQKPTASHVDVRVLREGECVQVLHVGPYAEEPKTLHAMSEFMKDHELRPAGRHHEIYFGDPRRTAPEKLRTLLRQPVEHAPTAESS